MSGTSALVVLDAPNAGYVLANCTRSSVVMYVAVRHVVCSVRRRRAKWRARSRRAVTLKARPRRYAPISAGAGCDTASTPKRGSPR
jgi:hypothetical protein